MINSHNTFSPLKEIILGDVDIHSIKFDDPRKQRRVEHIFTKTKVELDNFQKALQEKGIKVHRPKQIMNVPIQTPYWSTAGTKIPLTPRDLFLVLGDTIIEMAMCEQERLFEPFYYRDILLEQFRQGAKWMAMPLPRHDYSEYVPGSDHDVPNQDPIIDGPSCLRYGKDILVNTRGSGNSLGFEWLKSMFADRYTFHEVDIPGVIGHLDAHFSIIRPGLLLTHHKKDRLPKLFDGWDIIQVDPTEDKIISQGQQEVDSRLQDFDFENTVLSVNCLGIDTNTIIMWDHYRSETTLVKALDKHKIETMFIPLTYSHFFNQGVNCVTLDLHRDTPEGLVRY